MLPLQRGAPYGHAAPFVSGVRLSVVVTVVDGGSTLEACLHGLRAQKGPPSMQVIIPFDDSISDVGGLSDRFPNFEFLPLGSFPFEKSLRSPAGQHELYDRRRSAGLRAARGEIVGILEDRGIPDPDWAALVDTLHSSPYAVIGGAVECGVDRTLNWAVYFCDFGRYQLPFNPGPRSYVTDVNISYKREALEKTRHLWSERFHETTVNWALTRSGETLLLTPDLVVRQERENLRFGAVLLERFAWGRLFAYTRVRECSSAKRAAYACLAPVLPLLLFVRHSRMQAQKRVRFGTFVRVSPLVAIFLAAWSLGELLGYLTGRP